MGTFVKGRRGTAKIRCLSLLFAFYALTCVGFAQDVFLQKVRFIPQWIPQAQFAGYYMALEKGFYRKHGLDVTILRGGPTAPASDLVEQGRADFGSLFLATAIASRARGVKLVNLAQIVQRSSIMLVTKKKSGILEPQDLQGKKVGLWGPEFQLQAKAFFNRFDLTVKTIPQSTTVNLFLRDGVDAASAMWYNEYHTILNSGLDPDELTTFFFFDYGLNFPEDGIYCLEQTYRRNPAMSCRFVQASLEGWRYAFEHQQETLDVVMRYVDAASIATNRTHQKWMLDRMQDLIVATDTGLPDPILKIEEYLLVGREMVHNQIIDKIPAYPDFFVDCLHDLQK